MTDQIREQLSALLDGELPKDEMGLLVRRLEKDAALRRAFGTYALIGETLRAPGGRLASTSFAAGVSAAIDGSAVPAAVAVPAAPVAAAARLATTVRYARFWQRPVVRTALAASAAAAAVLVFQPDPTPLTDDSAQATLAGITTASPTPAQSQRLATYMVAHSQYSTPMVRRNVLSSLLAAEPGITRISYEMGEAP